MPTRIVTFLTLALVVSYAAASEKPNLVRNPDFESDQDGNGQPDAWTPSSPDTVLRPVFELVTAPVRSGKHAAACARQAITTWATCTRTFP